MADLMITDYTDPACPFAFSAEPSRIAIQWMYGEQVEWHSAMVGLAEDAAAQEKKGLTTEMVAGGARKLQREHGMPMDTTERPRLSGSVLACRAVVAARLRGEPGSDVALLRALRVHNFRNEMLDEPATIAAAAADAGIDAAALEGWMAQDEVETALREDMRRARHPRPAALVLDSELADWEEGRRYTCPSYEIGNGSTEPEMAIPGFQPFAVYDVALANVAPKLARRPAAENVTEVLEWAPYPLATAEVAAVRGISLSEARTELAAVATEQPSGDESYWSLAA